MVVSGDVVYIGVQHLVMNLLLMANFFYGNDFVKGEGGGGLEGGRAIHTTKLVSHPPKTSNGDMERLRAQGGS